MSTQKFYSIIVPVRHIAPAYEGKLNNETQLPEGETIKVHPALGHIIIPNHSKVWGKRKKGVGGKPTGEIEFMPWGTEGGEAIDIRYHPSSKSIDKQYQILTEKLVIPTEVGPQGEIMDIRLQLGKNEFDENENAAMVEILKNHSWNGKSIGRNPKLQVMFTEYVESESNKANLAEIRKQSNAVNFAIEARDNKQLTVLAHIFGLDARTLEAELHDHIIQLAKGDSTYTRFLSAIDDFKADAEKVLVECVETGLLKNEEGKEIMIIRGGQPQPLLKDVAQEGDSVVQFFIYNILQEEFYNAYKELQGTLEKAKVLLLD